MRNGISCTATLYLPHRTATVYVHFNDEVELKEFTSERFGVYGDIAYRF